MSRKAVRKKPSYAEETVHVQKVKYQLKPKTANQENLIRVISENTVTLATGPSGTGKTMVATSYGMEKFLAGEYKRLVICRPAIEAGEDLGYLPGKYEEKVSPYLQPVYAELCKYVSMQQLQTYLNNGKNKLGADEIIVAPLAYMRGLNFHDSFMIIDEAQNATYEQIKMFITRVGFRSKCVLSGDVKQSDLNNRYNKEVALDTWINQIYNVPGVGVARLEKCDIIRNPIISDILEAIGE